MKIKIQYVRAHVFESEYMFENVITSPDKRITQNDIPSRGEQEHEKKKAHDRARDATSEMSVKWHTRKVVLGSYAWETYSIRWVRAAAETGMVIRIE